MVCEPQYRGAVHSPFNAALLESLRHALPGWRIVFLADPTHLPTVTDVLKGGGLGTSGFEFIEGPVGDPENWGRADEANAIKAFVTLSRRRQASLAVLTSFSSTQLTIARLLLPALAGSCALLAILHDNVAHLTGRKFRGLGAVAEAIRTRVNSGYRPRRALICVLGKRPLENVRQVLPEPCVQLAAIRHPYLFDPAPGSEEIAKRLREPVVALVGNTRKGRLEEVVSAARTVRSMNRSVKFVLAGSLWTGDPTLDAEGAGLFEPGASSSMLNWQEFVSKVRAATFGVVHLDPSTYQTRASGAVLDTFSACLPSILRSVPFVDSCCEDDGIPAIRYENGRALERSLVEALRDFPPRDYHDRVRAIAERRMVFSPENVALEIRAALVRHLGITVEA